MKRFFVVLTALVCVLGLSISSFAYSTIPAASCNYLTYNEDGDFYALNVELKISALDADDRKHWKLFTDAFTSKSDDHYIVYQSGQVIFFLVMSSDTTFYNSPSLDQCIVNVPAGGYRFMLGFYLTSGERSSSQYISGPHPGGFSKNTIIKTSYSEIPSKVGNVVDFDGKRLQIIDDIGDLEPEEPDPPSSSEPSESIPDLPKPGDYNPTLPTIPTGDGLYVPYDTAVWDTFLERTKQNIGSATNIGFLIFGIAVVWSILTRLVKKYTKP